MPKGVGKAWPPDSVKVKLLAQKAGVLSIHQETGEIVLAGDDRTWSGLLGVQRPYGDGVKVGHTRVRLDIKRLGKNWRQVLEKMLTQAAGASKSPDKAQLPAAVSQS